jgi:hypothetical protein
MVWTIRLTSSYAGRVISDSLYGADRNGMITMISARDLTVPLDEMYREGRIGKRFLEIRLFGNGLGVFIEKLLHSSKQPFRRPSRENFKHMDNHFDIANDQRVMPNPSQGKADRTNRIVQNVPNEGRKHED